jgi:hypothetical protein
MGSDQAGYVIGAGLGQKQGRFSVLNRCFWGQKERFKKSSSGKRSEIGNFGTFLNIEQITPRGGGSG